MSISTTLVAGYVYGARARTSVAFPSTGLQFCMPINRHMTCLAQRLAHQPKPGGYVVREWTKADMGANVAQSTLLGRFAGFSATDNTFPTRVGPPPLSISV
jgi:hypothetical protein